MVEQREPCRVGPIDFEVTTLDEAVRRSIDDAVSGQGGELHFANAWSIALATEDNNLVQAFRGGLNYPDGKPVVWAMRMFRRGHYEVKPNRVNGPTFFEKAVALGISRGVKHYFLGSTPETLEKLQHNLRSRYPTIRIVGVSSPPYKEHTAADYDHELDKIRACRPDIVWIGLGTPKQDMAAAYMSPRYPAVFACVGGVFDFAAGNFRDAPDWMQEAGLAWLYRFVQEPRRLWRRYTYGNAKFIGVVLKQFAASGSGSPR
jgi:N-acetylglucosaminyldiphosphoundecaprenol N-acetyl-beta-D-mannosaminyltransferase